MKKPEEKQKPLKVLHDRARKIIHGSPEDIENIPADDIKKLVHALEKHQVELEIQNNELRQTRVKEALRVRDERYSDLYENAPSAYFSINSTDGSIIRFNHAALKLLGYERESLKQLKVLDLYADTPHGLPRAKRLFKRFQAGESVRDAELQMERADGRPVWVSLSVDPVKDPAGRIVESRSMILDISERKRVEEALHKSAYDLGERIKELNCLHGISKLREKSDLSLGEILQGIIDLIPSAWQYPRITCAQLVLKDQTYKTSGFKETIWKQTSRIMVYGEQIGALEIYYLEQKPEIDEGPFLKEERNLIDSIAEQIGLITEHKQSEGSLRESEERFRLSFENANVGMCLVDISGHYLKVNNRMCEIFGYRKDELEGTSVYDITHPEYLDVTTRFIKRAASGEIIHDEFERKFLHKQGQIVWTQISSSVVQGDNGEPLYLVSHIIDITQRKVTEETLQKSHEDLEKHVRERTAELMKSNEDLNTEIEERKHAEEALRESEEKLTGIINSITDQVVMLDEELNIVWANEVAKRISGPDLLNKKCYRIHRQKDKTCIPCIAEKCFRDGGVHDHEIQAVGSDGNLIEYWVSASPAALHEDGRPRLVITIFRNITEKKALQAETLRTAHLVSIGELAAGVAHEINNPINAIINLSQVLLNECDQEGLEHEVAGRIKNEGNRIAVIVRSLLDFSRERQEKKSPVSLHKIIFETLALTEAQLRKDGIDLEVDIPPNLPDIIGQIQPIQQVFLNLINNSRYALNQKYPGAHEDKILQVRSEALTIDHHPYVRVIFHDRGTGINTDIIGKVMNPFYSTKPVNAGTGLGLSICHGIVSDHGGRMKIESVEGEYTKMIIDLPAGGESETQDSYRR